MFAKKFRSFWELLGLSLSKRSVVFLLLVIVLMSLVYVSPLWYIQMGGRQFTEPLQIYIWAHKITGGTDVDLYTINDFNHYIGMQKIKPESIPELRYMPFILAYMLLGGLITLLHRKIYMIMLGLVNLVLVGLVGLYDFWGWLHSYGTDLDTSAPLYDKSVDFQPPVFACKDILNVTTCSWPHLGAIFLLVSMGLLLYVVLYEKKQLG